MRSIVNELALLHDPPPKQDLLLRSPFFWTAFVMQEMSVFEGCHLLSVPGPQRASQAGGDPEGEVRPFELDLLNWGPDQL